jgi:CRISPR-associated endonuclease Cas1
MISLEALRWLSDVGIGLLVIEPDAKVLAYTGPAGGDHPRLRRAQALAAESDVGVEIMRRLLGEKVQRQGDLLPRLPGGEEARSEIEAARKEIEAAKSLRLLLDAEAAAAAAYWKAWGPVEVRFPTKDQQRVSTHWLTFGGRRSPISKSPRLAANPANAMLNYLYAILEGEAKLACLAVGLDPGLGIAHADAKARASLALDVQEAVRPAVDADLLDVLETTTFAVGDFHETRRGVCRVLAPLSHRLAETAPESGRRLAPLIERTAAQLLGPGGGSAHVATPLTQANRRAAWDRRRKGGRSSPAAASPAVVRRCEACGTELAGPPRRRRCGGCAAQLAAAHQAAYGPAGADRLRDRPEIREAARAPEAMARRVAALAKRRRAAQAWERKHSERPDPAVFLREILPRIKHLPLSRLRHATGLSWSYCSGIRRGLNIPHPMHWEALAALSPGSVTSVD